MPDPRTRRTHRSVLVVVKDGSLGGTSRSAIMMARAWQAAGADVALYNAAAPAQGRSDTSDVDSYSDLRDIPWDRIDLVNLHHWNWHSDEVVHVQELMATIREHGAAPALLTNNIFSAPDELLSDWPGPRAVGVLGEWSAEQYRASGPHRRRPTPFVIPNPQDTEFFRPPSAIERANARQALGIDGPTILRAGSPLEDKWSTAYGRLAREAEVRGVRLVLVSPPPAVEADVGDLDNVDIVGKLSDDELLRQWYWASDLFALDAQRGESFGNVLTESLLCGTPACYRGRPLRDNTPHQLRDIEGFTYVTGARAWVDRCLDLVTSSDDSADDTRTTAARATVDSAEVARRFGIEAVGARLADVADALLDQPAAAALEADEPAGDQMGWHDRLAVRVRHNPLAASVKDIVNRRRAG